EERQVALAPPSLADRRQHRPQRSQRVGRLNDPCRSLARTGAILARAGKGDRAGIEPAPVALLAVRSAGLTPVENVPDGAFTNEPDCQLKIMLACHPARTCFTIPWDLFRNGIS